MSIYLVFGYKSAVVLIFTQSARFIYVLHKSAHPWCPQRPVHDDLQLTILIIITMLIMLIIIKIDAHYQSTQSAVMANRCSSTWTKWGHPIMMRRTCLQTWRSKSFVGIGVSGFALDLTKGTLFSLKSRGLPRWRFSLSRDMSGLGVEEVLPDAALYCTDAPQSNIWGKWSFSYVLKGGPFWISGTYQLAHQHYI